MQTVQTTVREVAEASRKMKAMIAQMAAENGGTNNRADGIASQQTEYTSSADSQNKCPLKPNVRSL